MKEFNTCLALCLTALSFTSIAQTVDKTTPLLRTHAHNDYEHTRPLLDALEQRFCSVEADVWLVEGQLLVAHELKAVQKERTLSKWRGKGPLPEPEKAKLKALVAQAHAQGRRIRFWNAPDSPAGWSVLLEAGVDLINTDNLTGLHDFLLTKETDK